MQFFNELNARKLGQKEFNIFAGFFNNFMFLVIIAAQGAFQVFMSYAGGQISQTCVISFGRYIACVSIGAFSLVVAAAVKATPDSLLQKIPALFDENAVDNPNDSITKIYKSSMKKPMSDME